MPGKLAVFKLCNIYKHKASSMESGHRPTNLLMTSYKPETPAISLTWYAVYNLKNSITGVETLAIFNEGRIMRTSLKTRFSKFCQCLNDTLIVYKL